MQNEVDQLPRSLVVIGVPGSRRVSAFERAAFDLGVGPIDVVSYLDWIGGRGTTPPPGSLVRIESPSGCDQTTRAILKAGIAPLEAEGGVPICAAEIDRIVFDRGEMLHPRQWFFGFREILKRLEMTVADGEVRWMSRPAAIVTAFDKLACLDLWYQSGLPVPRRIPGIASYAQIRHEIPDRHARLFVKLRYGYSAMGAVALEWRGTLVRAITTMEVTGTEDRRRLFVTKQARVLTREAEIEWLVDTLAREEVLVEQWLPKSRYNGIPYDLRVVVIGGKPHHVVGRASNSPFTNLNLDAIRVPCEVVEGQLGDSWPRLLSLCEQAAACIHGAGVLGMDVLIHPCRRRFAVLEANAFGDYLPDLLHLGHSTYEAELRKLVPNAAGVMA